MRRLPHEGLAVRQALRRHSPTLSDRRGAKVPGGEVHAVHCRASQRHVGAAGAQPRGPELAGGVAVAAQDARGVGQVASG